MSFGKSNFSSDLFFHFLFVAAMIFFSFALFLSVDSKARKAEVEKTKKVLIEHGVAEYKINPKTGEIVLHFPCANTNISL